MKSGHACDKKLTDSQQRTEALSLTVCKEQNILQLPEARNGSFPRWASGETPGQDKTLISVCLEAENPGEPRLDSWPTEYTLSHYVCDNSFCNSR